jgi:GT2 family glycosyltransferase
LTTADYLCCYDADDLLDDDFLEAHLAVLEARPTAGFAFGRIREFGERQRLWPKQVWDHDLLRRWNYVPAASLVRTSAFRQVGGVPRSRRCRGLGALATVVRGRMAG